MSFDQVMRLSLLIDRPHEHEYLVPRSRLSPEAARERHRPTNCAEFKRALASLDAPPSKPARRWLKRLCVTRRRVDLLQVLCVYFGEPLDIVFSSSSTSPTDEAAHNAHVLHNSAALSRALSTGLSMSGMKKNSMTVPIHTANEEK